MVKKNILKLFGILLSIFFVCMFVNVKTVEIFSIPNNTMITQEDFKLINSNKLFGKYVTTKLSDKIEVGNNQEKLTKLLIKLFGIVPIREIDVTITNDKEVYIGGIPLGFAIDTDGLLILGENSVSTMDGEKEVEKSVELKNGDIISKINNKPVCNTKDVQEILENNNQLVELEIIRKGKIFTSTLKPILDEETNQYKLGLWVRNTASGIGTLSYVDTTSNKFGALGHSITDYETGVEIPIKDGKVYNCSLLGIKKGEKGNPGELRCLFLQGKNYVGTVQKNSKYGVFGEMTNVEKVVDNNKVAEIGSRLSVKLGDAKIVSSISGVREEYNIEIIKANYQNKSNDKSIVFRVKDKRLLNLSGGIVQGMSGSPILQNGKLIGSVTHVFVSDPTKGYGVYADWMLEAE